MNGYRALLRLAPRRLRLRHGRAMEALFRHHLAKARVRGPRAVVCVWTAALVDLLGARMRHALAWLHTRDRIGPNTPRSPIMLGSDVRYALRSLTRQKLGSGLVVAMLATGIAANIAVFSLVNGLFLRPFPYPEPDRLVYLNERAPRWGLDATSINFPDLPWFTVVGVVEDARHYGLEQPMRPGIYMPLPLNVVSTLTAVAKTSGDPAAIAGSIRAMVRELDPELPLFNVRTMQEALQRSMALRTVYSWMLAVFACMAVVLALGGTYGVTSYFVSQRLREIGIRVALGARRLDIIRSVLKGSLAVLSAGILLGLLASVRVAGLLSDLLFGVSPTDVAILAGAAAVLIATALLANVIPARRAAGVDPMISLRTE